jgi:hypothetical protein
MKYGSVRTSLYTRRLSGDDSIGKLHSRLPENENHPPHLDGGRALTPSILASLALLLPRPVFWLDKRRGALGCLPMISITEDCAKVNSFHTQGQTFPKAATGAVAWDEDRLCRGCCREAPKYLAGR